MSIETETETETEFGTYIKNCLISIYYLIYKYTKSNCRGTQLKAVAGVVRE